MVEHLQMFDTARVQKTAVEPVRHDRWLYHGHAERHYQMGQRRRDLMAEDIMRLNKPKSIDNTQPMMYGTPSNATLDTLSNNREYPYTYISRGEKPILSFFADGSTPLGTLNHTVRRLPTPMDGKLPVIEQLKRANMLYNEHPSKQDLRRREQDFKTAVRVADQSFNELAFMPMDMKLYA